MKPYFATETITLYKGDCREVLPRLDIAPDCVVADPPYGETSLAWDRWPDGWPAALTTHATSLWCFGSMRMFLDRRDQFDDWRLSQDVVWEKHNGSGFAKDRFRRVHEHVTHWYRGNWWITYHQVPKVARDGRNQGSRRVSKGVAGQAHLGKNGFDHPWIDDGTRLMRSVIQAPSMKGSALHPTEKPVDLLRPLIEYACPPGGLVLDPFAGSGSTAAAALSLGRRAVLIEADERYCEVIANRLSNPIEA